MTHTWISDLKITLEHDGVQAVVWNRAGGSGHDIHQRFELDAFNGADSQGTWTLHLADNYSQDTGSLDGWALEIKAL